MTRLRTLAGLAAALLLVAALPVAAEDGDGSGDSGGDGEARDEFVATGSGAGFDLRVADEGLTIGFAEVGVQSDADGVACEDDLACAAAAGETLLGETASVSLSQGTAQQTATALDLGDLLGPALAGGIGIAEASALVEGGVTAAEARGGAADLQVTLNQELLDGLDGDPTEALEEVLQGLGGGGEDPLGELSAVVDREPEVVEGALNEIGLPVGPNGRLQWQGGEEPRPETRVLAEDLVNALDDEGADAGGDHATTSDTGTVVDDADSPDVLPDDGAETQQEEIDLDELEGVLDGLLDDGDGEAPEDLLGTLTGILEQLLEDITAHPLVGVRVGPAMSEATDENDVTSALAGSHGAQVVVLPTPEDTADDPQGLVILELGASRAEVNSDRLDATADFDAAVARLRVFDPQAEEYIEVAVEPGQSQCVGVDPLEICVEVGHGDTNVEGSGASAAANAVSITALNDPLPEVSLALAAAEAAVNATSVEPPKPEEPDLPVTGGGALIPGLLLLGVGTAGFVGLRRYF